MGSDAEVERLFSVTQYILSQGRRPISPQLFEALVFSKYNSRFWDIQSVTDAVELERRPKIVEDEEIGD